MVVYCKLYLCDINRPAIPEVFNLIRYHSQQNAGNVCLVKRQERPGFEPRSPASESNTLPTELFDTDRDGHFIV